MWIFALLQVIIDEIFSRRIVPTEPIASRPAVDESDSTDPVSPVPDLAPGPAKIEAPAIVPPPSMDYGAATPFARAILGQGHELFRYNGKPLNLNLLGVRDATPEWDKFGCRFVMFWQDDKGEWTVKIYPFTTYPGDYYSRVKLLSELGVMIMAEGQHRRIYKIRKHRGLYDALCQDGGPIPVYRDGNRDRVYDLRPSTIQRGNFGGNIHAPENPDDGIARDVYEQIGAGSAGCQVFQRPSHFLEARKIWKESRAHQGDFFTYTLMLDRLIDAATADLAPTIGSAVTLPRDYRAGWEIVELEERADENDYPILYELPGNDGGGRYEIAGINDRYHGDALRVLRNLPAKERQAYAARYIEDYTLDGTKLDEIVLRPGTRFFVLDSAFNRGPGGSAWIVQHALNSLGYGLKHDMKWGPKTRTALETADRVHASAIIDRLRRAREVYERDEIGYRANLWDGLLNRWNKVEKIAREWNGKL